MGSSKKQRKKYSGPRHPYYRERVDEEMRLAGEYGLRNKKEIWKAKTQLRNYRKRARQLLALTVEEREKRERVLVGHLSKLAIVPKHATLDDVLGLDTRKFLDRRLQTVVYKKGLASTPHQARQFIVHGHIAINGRRVDVPSYHVGRGEEEDITYAPRSPLRDEDHPVRQAMKELLSGSKPSRSYGNKRNRRN